MATKDTTTDRKKFLSQLDVASGGAVVRLRAERGHAPAFARPTRILLAVDGTDGSRPAVAWAAHLAKAWRARVTAVCVAPPLDEVSGTVTDAELVERMFDEYAQDAQAILDSTVAELAMVGVKADVRLEHGSPAARIRAVAKSSQAQLVILGVHGHGTLERLQLGSVADGVKNSVGCSVLLARASPKGGVVAAVDGSWDSLVAADGGEQAAVAGGGHAMLLRCINVPMFGRLEIADQVAAQAKAQAGRKPGSGGIVHVRVTRGKVAQTIVDFAEAEGAGLIAMGSRGMGAIRSTLLGGVSNRVSQRAACSVLIVKQPG